MATCTNSNVATCRMHAAASEGCCKRCAARCRDFYPANDAMAFARNALQAGMSAQEVANGLVDRALKRYTADNVSVVVLKFPWAFKGEKAGSAKPRKKGFGFGG